jgi:GT2 family glycosyltransferase/glycosyltransferase involved in cell wall biosynthesis
LKPKIQIAFASGSEDLVPTLLERMRAIRPDLDLWVVSEFAVEAERWIPYHPGRTWRQNLDLCRWAFREHEVVLAGMILQPRMPYWSMRLIALLTGGLKTVYFNENLDHFMLHPRSVATIGKHLLWRGKNLVRWELRPGGAVYTFLWRLAHPWAFERPLLLALARAAGVVAGWMKAMQGQAKLPEADPLEEGISVVIPSRNGKHLLEEMLPGLLRELEGYTSEVIVVDNGSDDGTQELLKHLKHLKVVHSKEPLSFARAVNRGIAASRYSKLLMLNNDMMVHEGFFQALLGAKAFAATAQIEFPEGVRREETGKAVMPVKTGKTDFPVRCDLPVEGEDQSYVLYGSGGCTLYDTRKLKQLGGLKELYEPAYVEDLDLGYRAWQQGWATVFVAGAKVTHKHRATTSRYYSQQELDRVLEVNYLRFVAGTVRSEKVFRALWRKALDRLNERASQMDPDEAAMAALRQAWKAVLWPAGPVPCAVDEEMILAAGSGDAAVFPGAASMGRPVVIVASPYVPYPLSHGGAVRIYNLMREAAKDYDQVLVAFADELACPPAELLKLCVEVVLVRRSGSHTRPLGERPDGVEEFDSASYRAVLGLMVDKWSAGIVQLEFTQMAQYAPVCEPAKTVLVEHDVTLDLYAQLLEQKEDWETRQQYERWIRFERKAWGEVDAVVTMSEKDRRSVGHGVCLPNGVDLERFRPSEQEPEAGRVLFIGSFAHLPNVLAVEWFLREVWPHVLGTFHVIAGSRHRYYLERHGIKLPLDGVEVEDFVADPRGAYRRATVVVAPLLASAGTNIKIMEAMAMGKAVVSTAAGINGLDDLRDGVDVIVASNGEQMAKMIAEMMEDSEKRKKIERQARQTVEQRYGWDAIGARQRELYESLRPRTA